MNVIIVGCGRVGARLASEMEAAGHHVAVIDQRIEAFNRLPTGFRGEMVVGTGIDESVLRKAGIEKADCFASVTNGDNRNIMAAQIAQRVFNVPRVITRIYDPIREEVFRSLGLETVCPTREGSDAMRNFFTEPREAGARTASAGASASSNDGSAS